MAAALFKFRLIVSPMDSFASRFLSWLRDVSRTFGEVLTMFVLHLNNFLVVGDVSGIRHRPP